MLDSDSDLDGSFRSTGSGVAGSDRSLREDMSKTLGSKDGVTHVSGFKFKKGTGDAPLPNGPPPSRPKLSQEKHKQQELATFSGRLSTKQLSGSKLSQRLSAGRQSFRRILHRDNSQGFEYAFDDPNGSVDEETESVDDLVGKDANATEKQMASKVKGGVHGAGVAALGKIRNKHTCERAWVAALAVSMIWLTSYALARYIVRGVIVTPNYDKMMDKNKVAYERSEIESAEYVRCIERVSEECQQTYTSDNAREVARVTTLRAGNERGVEYLRKNTTYLSQLFAEAMSQVDVLAGNPSFVLNDYLINVNDDICKFVQDVVNGDDAAVRAMGTAQIFADTAEKAVISREQQLLARQVYDTQYRANKTKDFRALGARLKAAAKDPGSEFDRVSAGADKFTECIVSNDPKSCNGQGSTYTRFSISWNTMLEKKNELKQKSEQFAAAHRETLDTYRTFIRDIRGKAFTVFQQSLGSYQVPQESEANEPTNFAQLETLANYAGIDDPDKIFVGAADNLQAFKNRVAGDKSSAQSKNGAIGPAADNLGTNWDGAYNPPPVALDRTAWTNDRNSFLSGVRSKLQSIDARSNSRLPPPKTVVDTSAVKFESSDQILSDLTTRGEFDLYAYSPETIAGVNAGLEDLSNTVLYFDFVFRFIYSIMTIRKYWNLSALSTPAGDARVKAAAGKGWGRQKTPMQKISALVTNPLLINTVLMATVAIIVYFLWYMYSPIYLEYVAGCVDADRSAIITGNVSSGGNEGTMLYRNGYSILSQYSASSGDKIGNEKADKLNLGRNVECSQRTFDDTQAYNDLVDEYNALLSNITGVQLQNRALSGCIDYSLLKQNAAFRAAAEILEQKVKDSNWAYQHVKPNEAAIYNCGAVGGTCGAIRTGNNSGFCPGPSEPLLRAAVFEASCTTEWWLHAQVFGGFMIVSTYVLINISRIYLIRAIVRTFWQHIVVGPFSFLGSCTDRAQLLYPEQVTEKGDSMRQAIADALKLRIKKWERWGYVLFLGAILINGPWVYGLAFLGSKLSFSRE